jgi:hypothetical protein
MPSPFNPFDTQYSAHCDVTIHPGTGVAYITVAFHPNNAGGFNCRVWTLAPPYTGQPTLLRDWVQGQYSVGPFGHGASAPLPTGALLTVVPVAGNSNEVKPSILVDVGASPPYALGGGATDPRVDALIVQFAALSQQVTEIETALGNIGQEPGALDPADRKALDWIKRLLGPLVEG